ncbi:IS30 family transposase [Microtetraspora malaysiensis]|uniref:IS30 family transposase n=1 Tax=Microtetraspora malaysiensis TaxID=161358 RepID=UPI003D8FAD61
MSDAMKEDLWRRWRAGDSISVISRALGKPPGSVFTVLKHHGGIAPAERVRRADRLSAEDRESISRGLEAGASLRSIAVSIGRPASTVSREVARNGGRVKYRAIAAEQRAQEQARRPKLSALQDNPVLRQLVIELLDNEWSPEQIVGHLRLMHAGNPLMRISHESIYRAIYTTRWKVIPRELCTKLRTRRPIRKNKKNTVKGQWRSQITGARPIEERPDAANARTELGHLEGDLIIGAKNSQVATLVDRKSRYLTMVALPSRHTTTVIPALQQAFSRMDARLLSTLTWDRGMELAGHQLLTEATGVDVFFAAPRSPWQRGTNENTNKLIRQYLPKGIDLSLYSQADLDALAARLNNRPRKCLGYRTPAQCVALTL